MAPVNTNKQNDKETKAHKQVRKWYFDRGKEQMEKEQNKCLNGALSRKEAADGAPFYLMNPTNPCHKSNHGAEWEWGENIILSVAFVAVTLKFLEF